MGENIFFILGLSFLIVHEMDAVRCREWRIFPGLNLLSDKAGFIAFTVLHIPLFSFILYELINLNDNSNFIFYLEIFFIIHFILHLIYLLHPKNEFKDSLSWVLISGPAIFGTMDFLIF